MALDDKIYQLRKDKLKQIEALGQIAYPYRYEATHTVPQIVEEYSAKTAEGLENPRVNVAVAGRLMSIRLQGKAGFAHLQQGGKRLQIYVKLDFVGEKGFALYKLLDIGDYIGVKGYLFRTRTNELTVHVDLDSPRIGRGEGEPVFMPHGSATEYLERMNSVLAAIHQGVEATAPFVATLLRHELIESFASMASFTPGITTAA